ncbi:C40 family peptidase [Bartonella sp. F02]|uniref:C40 family peptidase n=1 Tax=Bartonella sp. F02 TaxID=2967262 RepID=UPI0022A9A26F|nr:NlpC/P60 family protein [Bartonella sp. F02]MCZ2328044.1 NlpC/P60 family protein [Bartonella sp. F02]
MTHEISQSYIPQNNLTDKNLERKRVNMSVAGLFKNDSTKSERQTECLFGEELLILEYGETMSLSKLLKDNYVGYVETKALCTPTTKQTHIVSVPRTFLYLQADLRGPAEMALSMGSKVSVVDETEVRNTMYSILDDGKSIVSCHLKPIEHVFEDYVSVAQTFLHTPYFWGGISGFGIDCSGFVQTSMLMAGRIVARDTAAQKNTIGTPLTESDSLQRGDLIFWEGHVAIMFDDKNIIHANGHSMNVAIEPLEEAITRIAKMHEYPVARRRPI